MARGTTLYWRYRRLRENGPCWSHLGPLIICRTNLFFTIKNEDREAQSELWGLSEAHCILPWVWAGEYPLRRLCLFYGVPCTSVLPWGTGRVS